ncbi:flagellar basal body-associated protein FliL [Phaeobacter sp. 22II1-1F12B]|uniref:flagellar basal body-associated FliL family protein n=1 Tax=Phaeobacter sp. 22II1-1F12B TaxID=1317111 RepID=UPI000B525D55|nr:flagellar basal body-associated FliL family protein [Phaeobacter sp. 22II1-1F12B]OWU78141.1 hypothetical protein ATO1_14165 [Phaeobacter sp. 22II1-1F12B]
MAAETDSHPSDSISLGKKLGIYLLLLVLGCVGAIGGLMLSPGREDVIASILGAEPEAEAQEDHGEVETAEAAHGADDGHGAPADAEPAMTVSPFREIIVNINATTATGRTTSRFMKLNIAMVYDPKIAGSERVEQRRLFLRDSFQDYLRQLNERDLRGSIGLITIKQELLHRARTITESDSPQEMLVSDLIVQ